MKKKTNAKAAVCAMLVLCTSVMLSGCGEVPSGGSSEAKTETAASSAAEASSEDSSSEAEQSEQESSEMKEEASSAAEESSEAPSSQADESSTADSKPEETEYDFTGMSGYWYIDGDFNTASIHITKEGTFTSFYATGSEECRGKIVRELDPVTNNYVFALYNETDSAYLYFADDGEGEKTDLYSISDYPVHFVKLYGEGGLGDDGRGPDETDDSKPGDEYLGTWGCGRATINIYKTDMPVPERDRFFYIDINWGDSAFAYVEWSLVGEYEDGKLICDKNGVKTYVEYTDAESAPKRTVEYTEGSAEFEIRDGVLYWNDKEENAAVGMEFIK